MYLMYLFILALTFKDERNMLIPEIQLNFLDSDRFQTRMNSHADANPRVIAWASQFPLDGVKSNANT